MARWSNWAGNQVCAPDRIEQPTSEADLVAIVERARVRGGLVRVAGSGHSFTPVVCTDDALVDLSGYQSVLAVDREAATVTVQAGIPLSRLNRELDAHGLALENLGDIAYQTIAGATQTATHGTGARFGNLSSRIVGLRLVTGEGEVVDCTASRDADVLAAARVGIGALGLVSTVTVQCVPAFNLHAVEGSAPVDEILEDLDAEVDGNDHFEFFWIPNTRWALTKRNRRTHEPVRPRPQWKAFRDDVLYDNVAFGLMCRIGRWRDDLIPRVARRLPSKGASVYVDASYNVFASPRHVHFLEMEYAIPRAALSEALNRVRAHVKSLGRQISFPVEVRFVAPDDIPLSTASGRDTVTSLCTRTAARRTPTTSAGWNASWTTTTGARTGASSTSSGPRRSRRATRTGTTRSACGRAWTRTARSPRPPSSTCSVRSDCHSTSLRCSHGVGDGGTRPGCAGCGRVGRAGA